MLAKSTPAYMKAQYNKYLNSDMVDLFDLYKVPSHAKVKAYNYCINLMNELNGHDFRITGGSKMVFSAGFICDIDGEPAFVLITKNYDRYIPLSLLDNK